MYHEDNYKQMVTVKVQIFHNKMSSSCVLNFLKNHFFIEIFEATRMYVLTMNFGFIHS